MLKSKKTKGDTRVRIQTDLSGIEEGVIERLLFRKYVKVRLIFGTAQNKTKKKRGCFQAPPFSAARQGTADMLRRV
jgi:hypothetical protein